MKRDHMEFNISCSVLPRRCWLHKNKITKIRQNCQIYEVSNFDENFTQFLGYAVCWGDNYGGGKKFTNYKLFSGNFFGEFFFIFRKYLWESFLYFTVCAIINFTPALGQIQRVLYKLIFHAFHAETPLWSFFIGEVTFDSKGMEGMLTIYTMFDIWNEITPSYPHYVVLHFVFETRSYLARIWQPEITTNYRHPCVATVADNVLLRFILFFIFYRHPCVATRADYVLLRFILFFKFFIQRSFSETTRLILTKFSGIVYSGLVWIIR